MNGDPVRARAILDYIVVNVKGGGVTDATEDELAFKEWGERWCLLIGEVKGEDRFVHQLQAERDTERQRERDAHTHTHTHTQSNHVHARARTHTTENGGKEQRSSRGSE